MASPLAGLPLRYLIGIRNAPGVADTATVLSYDSNRKPSTGVAVGYVNRRQEQPGRIPGVDYKDPPDDIEEEYGEPAPEFGTPYFWQQLKAQCDKWQALGITLVEVDNLDTDEVPQALDIISRIGAWGFGVLVKNPHLIAGGDQSQLIRHKAAVGMIVEHSAIAMSRLDALRKWGGKADFPIRVVAYDDGEGGKQWADRMAADARRMQLADVGVTYSPRGEYQTVENILEPDDMAPPPSPNANAPWVLALPLDLGKYHDGSDVPMLCDRIPPRFPDDKSLPPYCDMAGPETAWCGIYAAEMLSRWLIKPPHKDNSTGGFMYVDAWLPFGKPIPHGQQRPGDLALWINNSGMHHIAFFVGNGEYIGGNQSNTVTKTTFPTPGYFRRPPPPVEEWKPGASDMPMLMRGSVGPAVVVLQTALNNQNEAGVDVDGEFGPATETAVINYQRSRMLEVDGIVGEETWQALIDELPPVEPPTGPWLTDGQIDEICDMAERSAIARYNWRDRGQAPLGYTKGLAVMFAQSLVKLKAGDTALVQMAQRIGTDKDDALRHYGVEVSGEKNVLRKLFVMLFGLGMRESSGNFTEGRDMSADNVSADTAEAGCFQQSWNSHAASSEMDKLLNVYSVGGQPCFAEIWSEGIEHQNAPSYGSGPGRQYQDLAKACPAFATEMCGVGLRVLYNHWGPIVRHEAEMRPEAEALLQEVAEYMAAEPAPIPPEPEPPATDVAVAKSACMADIEIAVDKLIEALTGEPAP